MIDHQRVDSVDTHFVSLAVDHQSRAHMAYGEFSTGVLRYARESVTGFEIETIASNARNISVPQLAVTEAGTPCVLYVGDDEYVWFRCRQGPSQWDGQGIAIASAPIALAMDNVNAPHIALTVNPLPIARGMWPAI